MNSPLEITNYNRTASELEEFWIFCLFVQGRNSDFGFECMRRVVNSLGRQKLGTPDSSKTPFDCIRHEMEWNSNYIHNLLVVNGVGQYTRFARALEESLQLDLRTATLKELLSIHGIGPKTARFFLVHSRGGEDYAVLDVHILRWLRQFYPNAPQQTPSTETIYRLWEERYFHMRKQNFSHMKDAAQIDLLIWSSMSGRI